MRTKLFGLVCCTREVTYKCQRVAQQNIPWRVIREVFGDLIEALVHDLVVILPDFECLLVDKVCS